jgi:hypothetical protein
MLWGGFGLRPSFSKLSRSLSASELFECDPARINYIFETCIYGDLEEVMLLYESLEYGGQRKIKDLDVSYFTKLIAFASECAAEKFKFLIYDKWTKLVHVHLMLDAALDPLEFFSERSLRKLCALPNARGGNTKLSDPGSSFVTSLIYPRRGKSWDAYQDYCERMNCLSRLLSERCSFYVPPSKVEAFVFGWDLRGKKGKSFENPRYWVQQNFAKVYASFIK